MIRILDIVFSLFALLILSPLFFVVIVILKFTGEGEIFYRQIRIGKRRKNFGLLKFATMLKNSESMGTGTVTIKGDPRILPFGKFLRDTKINELPQLINIVVGDISIIGYRPLTEQTFSYYKKIVQDKLINRRPGLSGIGSIIFRDEENILDGDDPKEIYETLIAPYKGELEVWYSGNASVLLYLQMIIFTVIVIFTKDASFLFKIYKNLPKPNEKLKDLLKLKI